MLRNFATLFDRSYCAKGLALHESLLRHSSEPFVLHILTMDMETFWLLESMHLENVRLIPLQSFEMALNLEPVRQSRSWKEFCWTVASSLMEYLLPSVDDVTYLDADLYFFSDQKVIFDEVGALSIGITPHRFPAHRKHMEINGIYNVGLVAAKNNDIGRECISTWARNCRDWCFNRVEEHHACGDQKYLDTWNSDYPGKVCSIQHPGVNLAPWNIDGYVISADEAGNPLVDGLPVVFYHFHEFQHAHQLTNYHLRIYDKKCIYEPYIAAWERASLRIYEQEKIIAERRAETELQGQRA